MKHWQHQLEFGVETKMPKTPKRPASKGTKKAITKALNGNRKAKTRIIKNPKITKQDV